MLLRLPAIFGDDMVLQRDMHVPVWGTAPAGKTVTVDIDGFTLSAEAGADGGWRLDLPPAPAGGPCTLRVRCGEEQWAAERVWRGEVWLPHRWSGNWKMRDICRGGRRARPGIFTESPALG